MGQCGRPNLALAGLLVEIYEQTERNTDMLIATFRTTTDGEAFYASVQLGL